MLLTLGEPAGIGPDCVLRAWQAHAGAFAGIVVAAPAQWLHERARVLGLTADIHEHASLPASADATGLHCWNPGVAGDAPAHPGKPSRGTAAAVVQCLRTAAMACMRGQARALVTGPIDKGILRDAGFAFPGHTEFLADLAGVKRVVMMLASKRLRVALLTTHMPLARVPASLNVEDALACIEITARELERRFGIDKPGLALCALNPHAGEGGHFGSEELEILGPAAAQARRKGIDIHGPAPADTLFTAASRSQFDAIICCYHDQGLIPLKALSFGDAVNITLGLPFVRTSVDHGTAYDRAGKPDVSYSSLMAAITMARAMSHIAEDKEIKRAAR